MQWCAGDAAPTTAPPPALCKSPEEHNYQPRYPTGGHAGHAHAGHARQETGDPSPDDGGRLSFTLSSPDASPPNDHVQPQPQSRKPATAATDRRAAAARGERLRGGVNVAVLYGDSTDDSSFCSVDEYVEDSHEGSRPGRPAPEALPDAAKPPAPARRPLSKIVGAAEPRRALPFQPTPSPQGPGWDAPSSGERSEREREEPMRDAVSRGGHPSTCSPSPQPRIPKFLAHAAGSAPHEHQAKAPPAKKPPISPRHRPAARHHDTDSDRVHDPRYQSPASSVYSRKWDQDDEAGRGDREREKEKDVPTTASPSPRGSPRLAAARERREKESTMRRWNQPAPAPRSDRDEAADDGPVVPARVALTPPTRGVDAERAEVAQRRQRVRRRSLTKRDAEQRRTPPVARRGAADPAATPSDSDAHGDGSARRAARLRSSSDPGGRGRSYRDYTAALRMAPTPTESDDAPLDVPARRGIRASYAYARSGEPPQQQAVVSSDGDVVLQDAGDLAAHMLPSRAQHDPSESETDARVPTSRPTPKKLRSEVSSSHDSDAVHPSHSNPSSARSSPTTLPMHRPPQAASLEAEVPELAGLGGSASDVLARRHTGRISPGCPLPPVARGGRHDSDDGESWRQELIDRRRRSKPVVSVTSASAAAAWALQLQEAEARCDLVARAAAALAGWVAVAQAAAVHVGLARESQLVHAEASIGELVCQITEAERLREDAEAEVRAVREGMAGSELQDLRDGYEAQLRRNEDLEALVAKHEAELAQQASDAAKELRDLQDMHSIQRERNTELEQMLQEEQAAVDATRSDLERAASLEEELTRVQDALDVDRAELDEARAQADEAVSLRNALSDLRETYDELAERSDELEDLLEAKHSAQKQAEGDADALRARVADLDSHVASLERERDDAKGELERRIALSHSLQEELDRTTTRGVRKQEEAKAEMSRLAAAAEEAATAAAQAKGEAERQADLCNALQEQLVKESLKASKVEADLRTLRASTEPGDVPLGSDRSLQALLAIAEGQVEGLTTDLDKALSGLSAARTERDAALAKLAAVGGTPGSAQSPVHSPKADVGTTLAVLRADLAAARDEARQRAQEAGRWRAQAEAIRGELRDRDAAVTRAEEQRATEKAAARTAQRERDAVADEVAAAHADLRTLEEQNAVLEEQIVALEEQNVTLEESAHTTTHDLSLIQAALHAAEQRATGKIKDLSEALEKERTARANAQAAQQELEQDRETWRGKVENLTLQLQAAEAEQRRMSEEHEASVAKTAADAAAVQRRADEASRERRADEALIAQLQAEGAALREQLRVEDEEDLSDPLNMSEGDGAVFGDTRRVLQAAEDALAKERRRSKALQRRVQEQDGTIAQHTREVKVLKYRLQVLSAALTDDIDGGGSGGGVLDTSAGSRSCAGAAALCDDQTSVASSQCSDSSAAALQHELRVHNEQLARAQHRTARSGPGKHAGHGSYQAMMDHMADLRRKHNVSTSGASSVSSRSEASSQRADARPRRVCPDSLISTDNRPLIGSIQSIPNTPRPTARFECGFFLAYRRGGTYAEPQRVRAAVILSSAGAPRTWLCPGGSGAAYTSLGRRPPRGCHRANGGSLPVLIWTAPLSRSPA